MSKENNGGCSDCSECTECVCKEYEQVSLNPVSTETIEMSFKNIDQLEKSLLTRVFVKILSFVNQLDDVYGHTFNNIRLYYKLLKRTPIQNDNAIKKQVNIFLQFCKTNYSFIKNIDFNNFKTYELKFSDRVFINLNEIIKSTDNIDKEESIKSILTYLNLISYLLTGNDEFKNTLINSSQNNEKELTDEEHKNNENNFLNSFKSKIETNFKDSKFEDPLQAAMGLFNSGLFGEMMSDMSREIKDVNLNISKLLNSVQGMVKELSGDENNQSNGEFDISSMMNNLNMMGMPVDGMLGMMMNSGGLSDMMNGLNFDDKKDNL